MKNYITIDGGTTNTRICLVSDGVIIDTVKLSVGARAGIDSGDLLKMKIKDGITELLNQNNFSKDDIIKILASGMITSEFGLCNLPHIKTPAGIAELNSSMFETNLSEISQIPFVFIRGVKSGVDNEDSLWENDMMRGEETELAGIVTLENISSDCLFVLPGSHSKLIETDMQGRITAFSTMLTGEMIAALSQNTILKDAVDLSIENADEEYLIKGFEYCSEYGINDALFKARVLKNRFGLGAEKIYSFFLGTVLCSEIKRIIGSEIGTVAIGGKRQIKEATVCILKKVSDKKIILISDKTVEYSTSIGMIKIYEYDKQKDS